jgi:hypothetical protein
LPAPVSSANVASTISPGIIITPLAKDELTGPCGAGYRLMIELSAAGRAGQVAQAELAAVTEAIRQQTAQAPGEAHSPEAQAEAALALLDDVGRVTADPAARAEVNPLLRRLGLQIGLASQPAVKGTKRVPQRLVSRRMVFGDGPLPVPLFGKDNVDEGPQGRGCESPAQVAPAKEDECNQEEASLGEAAQATALNAVIDEKSRENKQTAGAGVVPVPAADMGDRAPDRLNRNQPEGISITKGSRGDWIRTSDLLNSIFRS